MAKSKKKPALPATIYVDENQAGHERLLIGFPSPEAFGRANLSGKTCLVGEYTLTRVVRISTSVAMSPE